MQSRFVLLLVLVAGFVAASAIRGVQTTGEEDCHELDLSVDAVSEYDFRSGAGLEDEDEGEGDATSDASFSAGLPADGDGDGNGGGEGDGDAAGDANASEAPADAPADAADPALLEAQARAAPEEKPASKEKLPSFYSYLKAVPMPKAYQVTLQSLRDTFNQTEKTYKSNMAAVTKSQKTLKADFKKSLAAANKLLSDVRAKRNSTGKLEYAAKFAEASQIRLNTLIKVRSDFAAAYDKTMATSNAERVKLETARLTMVKAIATEASKQFAVAMKDADAKVQAILKERVAQLDQWKAKDSSKKAQDALAKRRKKVVESWKQAAIAWHAVQKGHEAQRACQRQNTVNQVTSGLNQIKADYNRYVAIQKQRAAVASFVASTYTRSANFWKAYKGLVTDLATSKDAAKTKALRTKIRNLVNSNKKAKLAAVKTLRTRYAALSKLVKTSKAAALKAKAAEKKRLAALFNKCRTTAKKAMQKVTKKSQNRICIASALLSAELLNERIR